MPAADLKRLFDGCTARPLLADEPMSRHTSFRIGGPADLLAQPQDEAEVCALLARARAAAVRVTVIGNGSNLLVRDKGIRGLVLKLGNALTQFAVSGSRLTLGSGVPLAVAAKKAAELGLAGLEFATGIPGSIGGAVYMNAGAYSGTMADVVSGVRALDGDGRARMLDAAAMNFAYSSSALQSGGLIVTGVTLSLTAGDRESIIARMAEINARRAGRQPLELPSAGSMFKRPQGHFAGALIEQAGLKGYRVGGAQISLKHAGFVVNTGQATAADVQRLVADVQARVLQHCGVKLEPEVVLLGDE